MQRRQFIQMVGAGAAATSLIGCASSPINAKGAKVIVIGGGYG
ncbi:MAG: twin-arginine translocation signal domain-containing protein, partial [Polynucleobacter sp.]